MEIAALGELLCSKLAASSGILLEQRRCTADCFTESSRTSSHACGQAKMDKQVCMLNFDVYAYVITSY